jgi:hypothetical protein
MTTIKDLIQTPKPQSKKANISMLQAIRAVRLYLSRVK